MDDADITQERIDLELAMRIKATRAKATPALAPTGSCHNCGEAVLADSRWCDEFCRDDWQKREKNRP